MVQVQRKEYSMEELETGYNEITALYDLSSELIETVESPFVTDAEAQLALIEPLVNEIGEAADVLTEEYIGYAEGARRMKVHSTASKARVEAALRRVYVAINDYRGRVSNVTKQAYNAVTNIADPIVNKIQRQIEKIVVQFLEFVQLSLASIMNKTEMDQLYQRDARVALMLHQMSQQQS